MTYLQYLAILIVLFSSCQSAEVQKDQLFTLKGIDVPSSESGEPNLFVSETGQVYLSWVEYLNDTTDALLFSTLEGDRWSEPKTIASGTDWFVNWADFPSLVAYEDGGKSLAAHWLQKSAEGAYDYDVRIAQSFDLGDSWSQSFIPHHDSIAAEHGFVSMLPLSGNRIFATWLDGRNTKGEGHDHSGHGHHGAMTLRAATFDKEGNLYDEAELDNRICDCCQTGAALTPNGLVVAYRDRSEDEIRDISIVRQVNGKWQAPQTVFKDNWKIAGCPVNGPAIAAIGNMVAIAWFTMADESPVVKLAFSKDSGASFSDPIRVDEQNPLGRVDLVLLSENEALVSWMEEDSENADIKIVKVDSIGEKGQSFVAARAKSSRQSGFPRMVISGNEVILVWTAVENEKTIIKSAKLKTLING